LISGRSAEEDPSILGSQNSPIEILAFCTGLLPAAVAAVSKDTSELLKFGLEIISITFRLSFEITRIMRLIEDVGGNLATTIVGANLEKTQAILDEFYVSQVGLLQKSYLCFADKRTFRIFLSLENCRSVFKQQDGSP